MNKLTRADLWKLEDYARERAAFRARVLAHKQHRTVPIGEHVTLIFEDRLTMQYQVQEMLRIERIFEPAAIDDELAAYNPLIPDGSNLKATMMIEYDDAQQRRRALERLHGIENVIALYAGDAPPVIAIADEDMERSDATKTSAVHFLRFELTPAAIAALRGDAPLRFAIDHPHYRATATVTDTARRALLADLD